MGDLTNFAIVFCAVVMPFSIISCAIWRYRRHREKDKGGGDVEIAVGSGARGLRERNIAGLADTGRAVLEGGVAIATMVL
ncbi:hypothetical protein KY289_031642 [Solanum tuberosum]|nr:hypothetical protein KY289_031642 [Solanum tuberosum]